MSEQHSEDGEMSSLAEMQSLVHAVADYTSPSNNWKDRVQAAARALGFGWSRTKDLYYQDARRIDAEEMDLARKTARRLKAADDRRRAAEHLEWVRATVQLHRQGDTGMDSGTLDAVERFVGLIGDEDGAVVAVAAEDEDQSEGRGF